VAGIGNEPGGRKRILWVAGDGRHMTFRLGKVSQRQAEAVKRYVEDLVIALKTGNVRDEATALWVDKLPDVWRKRLAKAGLLTAGDAPPAPEPEPEPKPKLTLAAWLTRYIEGRGDVADNTRLKYQAAEKELLRYFGSDKPLDAINPGDGEDFNIWLRTKRGLSEGTARRRVGICKQFLAAAVKRRLLRESPFAEVKCGDFSEDRFHFVPPATAHAVMKELPSPAWRLVFALTRWGGLRCPSEVTALTWADVTWADASRKHENGRFTVRSRKTARYNGKGSRVVPIFDELVGPFLEASEAAEAGAVYCCPQYPVKIANQMYRKMILQALARAGVEPWEKLFVNLRATRETELVSKHPGHVAAKWLGHSPKIALKHYLMVTDDDFARASGAAQKMAQYLPEPGLPERERETADVQQRPDLPHDTEPYTNLHINLVGRAGVEPATPRFSAACSTA